MSDFACRPGCGACCIVLEIAEPYEGHPDGKRAEQRCSHLTSDNLCGIYDRRPAACSGFAADISHCGSNADEAARNLRLTVRLYSAVAEGRAIIS